MVKDIFQELRLDVPSIEKHITPNMLCLRDLEVMLSISKCGEHIISPKHTCILISAVLISAVVRVTCKLCLSACVFHTLHRDLGVCLSLRIPRYMYLRTLQNIENSGHV